VTRLWRRACATLVVAALAVAGVWEALAQNEPPPLAPNAPAKEQEALALLDKDELVTARRIAEEILEADPDSMIGHYVLGRALHSAEGSLPNAMAHMGRARELYEKRYAAGDEAAPWRFHQQVLYSTAQLAQEMEEFEFELQILDYHDALYTPMASGEHAWPLMRLERYDEAKKFAALAADSKNAFERTLGLNAACAIEGETEGRESYYKACLAALDNKREALGKDPHAALAVDAYNAALAALAAFKPDEAEKIALEGTKRLAFTNANPWRLLAVMYAGQGRAGDAINALREMGAWRRRQPANVRGQDRAQTDAVAAQIFLLAGETERGLGLIDVVIDQPDRRGLSSSSAEQALGGHALLRRALRRAHRGFVAERATWTGVPAKGATARAAASVDSWASDVADEERIVRVMSDRRTLQASFRPYLAGGLDDVQSWLVGDLVEVLGPGVVGAVLEDLRAKEERPEVAGYFDALEAEVALAHGSSEAAALAKRALDALPKNEALLRARVAAVGWRARGGTGQIAMGFLEQAAQLDGGVFRRMGWRVPAKLTLPADDVGRKVAELLEASPRLDVGDAGLGVGIEPDELGGPKICLYGAQSGARLQCGRPDVRKKEDGTAATSDEMARALVAAFHQKALALPLGLTGTDVSSLDGSTTTSSQAVRERLEEVLGE
jgi:hypothetical protein